MSSETFSFTDGEHGSVTVTKLKGDEDHDSKVAAIARIKLYLEKKASERPWTDVVQLFCVKGSSAYNGITASLSFEGWCAMLLSLSENHLDCTNLFGKLMCEMSFPSSPLVHSANITTKMKETKKAILAQFTAENKQPTQPQLDMLERTLLFIAKDEFSSLVWPATDYKGTTPFKSASRDVIAI